MDLTILRNNPFLSPEALLRGFPRPASVALRGSLTLQRKKMFWAPQKNAYLMVTRRAASYRERHQRHG
jgi:hypothetical protein